ncbi:hypothetical protein [Longimicrobium sp.]|uniref:hypothetical protein n=1 Tax=Longimicrobium sp. TaxID=2029185 RepID=UPI002E32C131|nr:hypothetical protein [Longimicrobium sp.]HEX6037988.1 hypothetical protein [Longimicrobium sp.]
MRRSSLVSIPVAAAALLLPAALAAQTSTPGASRPTGCRGTMTAGSSTTLTRTDGSTVVFPDYPVIESVQPGSPAEAGGMKGGDMLVVQDGHDMVGNPPAQPRLAGDTVHYIVRRDGAEVPLTVVLGAWDPAQETPDVERVCRPLAGPGQALASPERSRPRAGG